MKMHNVHAEIVFLVCFVTFLLFRIPVLASHVPLYLSPDLFWPFNREEKSLRHVVMVAKFLDDNKPKMSRTKWIRTSLNFIRLIQFYLIWQMLATFSQVESERTVFKFRKKKYNICVVFTHSIKRACEIKKFHVPRVQPRQRNEQNGMMHVVLSIKTYYFFVVGLVFCRCFVVIQK